MVSKKVSVKNHDWRVVFHVDENKCFPFSNQLFSPVYIR